MYQISANILPINYERHKIKPLECLRDTYHAEQLRLNKLLKNPDHRKMYDTLDWFSTECNLIAELCDVYNVDLYWLHIYEILNKFKLVNDQTTHYDMSTNAGQCVLSVSHYINTNCRVPDYKWYVPNVCTSDSFGIHSMYPSNHLHTVDKFNLITYVQNDTTYVNALNGLQYIITGGSYIFNAAGVMSSHDVSCVYAVATMFDECYLYMPQSTHRVKCTYFVICKGFNSLRMDYIQALCGTTPIFSALCYDKKFLKTIVNFNKQLVESAVECIQDEMDTILGKSDYAKRAEIAVCKWYEVNKILPFECMKMIDAYQQVGKY
jgi:hypothetical protein